MNHPPTEDTPRKRRWIPTLPQPRADTKANVKRAGQRQRRAKRIARTLDEVLGPVDSED